MTEGNVCGKPERHPPHNWGFPFLWCKGEALPPPVYPTHTSDGKLLHDWALNKDGTINIFAYEVDTHNGPECLRCGFSDCHHCNRDMYKEACFEQTDYLV